MKAYYELSYIDDFGNGIYEYFYCSEEQIKEKAKDLFDKEFIHVISEDKIKDATSSKTYDFDNELCKGYITKDVGYVLAHYIDWKKLDIDTNKKRVKNIYLLSNQCHWATSQYLGIYTNLKEAKKQLKLKLEKPSELAKEDDDGNKLPNGICKKTDSGFVCSYFYWIKTSYEYDEWDIKANTNILTKKEITKLAS